MKKLLALILIVLFAGIALAETNVSTTLSADMTALMYDNATNLYTGSSQGLYVGQYPAANGNYFYYVLCVIDLNQLGGRVSNVTSGSVTLRLDLSGGYTSGGWTAGFIGTDVTSQGPQSQINAIRGISGTSALLDQSITLYINMGTIVNNKIIIGVKRDGLRIKVVSPCSANINATVRMPANINVTYSTGSGNIVAYIGNYQTPAAPARVTGYENDQVNIAPLTANIPSYQVVYNENQAPLNKSFWKKKDGGGAQMALIYPAANSFALLKSEDNWTYEAQMKKLCNLNFRNSFVSAGSSGTITVNNISYSSPTSDFQVIEGNNISFSAVNQTISGITYSFTSWNDGSPSRTRTVSASAHNQYTASFTGKPCNDYRNLTVEAVNNRPVTLHWNEHPSTGVTQYQVWRIVITNGVQGSPQLIATVNRGTTTYVDPSYNYSTTATNWQLKYDVRAYYSTENTYADPDYMKVFYGNNYKRTGGEFAEGNSIENYAISNYPKHFNPITTINYQIQHSGFVLLKVYDMLGKEVITLVNEYKDMGRYEISFDGNNLASGTYFYELKVNDFVSVKKMMLTK